ncbi:MAG: SPASM domain-containing protein [Okeania sp. SIO3I5]|uniref:radical SAM/SPASM domain-containing protein n=1 Tax=Okeania sp. SIO3I5 TaxID=2607805 RepID=UPI0013B86EB1|nr:radical SAM protein [Okeania sp. SIO3I5]NEQ38012.1 SPASM domain-containing protein [Okeania sp. SIO3I5]
MKEKSYRWSNFTHVLERGDVSALYNSLKVTPVFVDSDLVPLIKDFGEGKTAREVIDVVDSEKKQQLTNLIPALNEGKILVDAESTDRKILEWFQGHYTDINPYVSLAYFILTDNCNFGCKYCFVESRMSQGYRFTHMTRETAQKGMDMFCRLISLDPDLFPEEKTILLYGGEPLLNLSTIQYILETVRERMKDGRLPEKTVVSMVTNGSLITPKIAKLLKTYNVNVAVSLDGDKSVTNSCRQYQDGKPVYDDVIKGIQILKREGVELGISCTMSQQCIDNFDHTLDLIINELSVDSLGFNIVMTGSGYKILDGYNEKAAQSLIKAFQIFRKHNIVEDRVMRKVDSFVKQQVYPFDCGAAGGGQIVMAPDGEVGICHGYLGDRKYFTTTVDDTTFNPGSNPVFQEWSKRSPLNMKECENCIALGICGGGCPLSADYETGSIWGLDSRFCVHSKMTLEWLIWDLFEQMQT